MCEGARVGAHLIKIDDYANMQCLVRLGVTYGQLKDAVVYVGCSAAFRKSVKVSFN